MPSRPHRKSQSSPSSTGPTVTGMKLEDEQGGEPENDPHFSGSCRRRQSGVYHRNHAELGFALKDQPEPDSASAERELDEAIRIRDHLGVVAPSTSSTGRCVGLPRMATLRPADHPPRNDASGS